MLKVLHIIPSLKVGGAETAVVRLVRALDPARVECRLYCCRPATPDDVDAAGLPVLHDSQEGGRVGTIRRLIRLIRSWRPDLIHLHLSLVGYVAARLAGVGKIIIHHHTGYPESLHSIRGLYLYETYLPRHFSLACSEAVREQCIQRNHLPPAAVRVLYNGIDLEQFDRLSRKRRGGDNESEVVLVTVGRLVALKGLDVLLEALARLTTTTRWRLLIAGEGEEEQPLRALSERLGLAERVNFLGNLPAAEIPGLLRSCEVMIQPSRREGLGLSAIEAGAARLPVIGSQVGGIPEIVVNDFNGLLVPPEDPAALAAALSRLCDDPAERSAMGEAGRLLVETKFAMSTIAEQLAEVYAEVVGVSDGQEGKYSQCASCS